MCTAITYRHYFGRNLDFEFSYQESVTIAPRNFPFIFPGGVTIDCHPAIIGMATVDKSYPLYYDATNEHGLSMAGLYFPGNAVYLPVRENMDNIPPFAFIPWILCQCKTVDDAKKLLCKTNLVDVPYSKAYPQSPLHWFIADRDSAITVEPSADGLSVYDNPIGVLTNNPPFPYHLQNLTNYLNVTSDEPVSRFAPNYQLTPYSRGMGGMGLPGDLSSASRFVRGAFTKLNSLSDDTEESNLAQFFHILGSVAQQRGCVKVGNSYEKTIYSSCCNIDKGIYYYTTYENSQITGVAMHNVNLETDSLSVFPLVTKQQVRMEN